MVEWLEPLYRSCYRRLVVMCCAVTGDLGAAQAAVGEAFVRAYGRRARSEEWVGALALRLSRRRARPRRRPAPETGLLAEVMALPEEQRVVVLAGFGSDRIASIVDLPEETVEQRSSEARAALVAALGTTEADLHGSLETLRERLRRAVHEPDVGTVVTRQRARVLVRRRRFGAVLAVVVAGAAIPVLRTALRPVADERPAAEPPAAEPTRSFVYDVDVDIGEQVQGYALRAVCPARSQTAPCSTEVLYTEDGAFWAVQSRLPPPTTGSGFGVDRRIHTLGWRKVVIESRSERWYSADSAMTWRTVPVEPVGAVEAIPTNAVLRSRCFVVTAMCQGPGQLLVTLPDSGRLAPLEHPPALDQLVPARIPAADGGWWVSGRDPATGRWSLAVSRDAGRSWRIIPLPPLSGTPHAGIAVSATQNTLYATAVGQLPDTAFGLLAIFRSTDAGTTWTTAWQADDRRQPHSISGALIAAPDGVLTVTTQDGATYVSTDAAVTFRQDPGPARYARWTRVGYIAGFGGTSGHYTWSRDGSQWHDFTIS
jgi:RNA polymerase sigma-70 factor (ECF subfamily)